VDVEDRAFINFEGNPDIDVFPVRRQRSEQAEQAQKDGPAKSRAQGMFGVIIVEPQIHFTAARCCILLLPFHVMCATKAHAKAGAHKIHEASAVLYMLGRPRGYLQRHLSLEERNPRHRSLWRSGKRRKGRGCWSRKARELQRRWMRLTHRHQCRGRRRRLPTLLPHFTWISSPMMMLLLGGR